MSRVQRFIAGFCCVTDDVASVSTISLGTAISAWCKAHVTPHSGHTSPNPSPTALALALGLS